jgi:hypothetical protein
MGVLFVAGQKLTAAQLNQYYGFSDTTDTTVTAAALTNLTTPYVIPANEPVVGSSYIIRFGGSGTQGSTAQTFSWAIFLAGTQIVANVNVAAAAFAINAQFRFVGEARYTCVATGVTGSFRASIYVDISETANGVGAFTAASQSIGLGDASSANTTIDTTAAMTAVVQSKWGSTTGAPTMTNRETIFQKVA